MKAYLDTWIVSGLAKSDLSSTEQDALKKILDSHDAGRVELCTSAEVEDELSAIPEEHREPHLRVFERFLDLPRIGGITSLGPVGSIGAVGKSRMLNRLKTVGLGEADARHILIATTNKVEYFVTTDKRTILRHAEKVQAASGIQAMLPSDFLRLLSAQ